MVINVKNLLPIDIKLYERKYEDYFKQLLLHSKGNISEKIAYLIGRPSFDIYANEMVKRVLMGERIGFVYKTSEHSDDILGFITGSILDDIAWISHIYVSPRLDDARQKEIALSLFKELTSKFQDADKREVSMEVYPGEERLRDFVSSLGFNQTSMYENGITNYGKVF